MNAAAQLRKNIGKKYMYLAKQVTIHNVVQDNPESDIIIQTSKKEVRVSAKKALTFFNENFLPVVETGGLSVISNQTVTKLPTPHISEIEPSYTPKMIMQDRSIVQSLKDTLLDSIDRIKKDDSYLPQATAINKTAKTLIDLAKAELELHRFNQK